MKLFTLLAIFLILSISSRSQIGKGQFLTGGNISYESEKSEGENVSNYKTNTFVASPNIGYFIVAKLAAGMRVDIMLYNQKMPNDYTLTSISLSPFLRYYVLSPSHRINVLVDAGYITDKKRYRSQTIRPPFYDKTRGFSLAAGPTFFFNEHVSLELLLNYQQTSMRDVDNDKIRKLNSVLGLQIHLGKIRKDKKAA